MGCLSHFNIVWKHPILDVRRELIGTVLSITITIIIIIIILFPIAKTIMIIDVQAHHRCLMHQNKIIQEMMLINFPLFKCPQISTAGRKRFFTNCIFILKRIHGSIVIGMIIKEKIKSFIFHRIMLKIPQKLICVSTTVTLGIGIIKVF